MKRSKKANKKQTMTEGQPKRGRGRPRKNFNLEASVQVANQAENKKDHAPILDLRKTFYNSIPFFFTGFIWLGFGIMGVESIRKGMPEEWQGITTLVFLILWILISKFIEPADIVYRE